MRTLVYRLVWRCVGERRGAPTAAAKSTDPLNCVRPHAMEQCRIAFLLVKDHSITRIKKYCHSLPYKPGRLTFCIFFSFFLV